ncbi:MAG: tellurite resistance protein [bacterium]|jgi:tellurite resistance protein
MFASIRDFLSTLENNLRRAMSEEISEEKKFSLAIIAAVTLISCADGVLVDQEIHKIREIISNNEDVLHTLSEEEAINAFKQYSEELIMLILDDQGAFNVAVSLLLKRFEMVEKPEWKEKVLYYAQQVATSDGIVHPKEKKMLKRIKDSFHK